MAIERTYLYGSDAAAAAVKLHDYLSANAVPDYFDSVTLDAETSTVTCHVGALEFLKIKHNIYNAGAISIQTASGSTLACKASGSDYNPPVAFYYAFKCAGGISFAIVASANVCLTITKDSKGRPAVICYVTNGTHYELAGPTTSSSYRLYVISPETQELVYKQASVDNSDAQLTAFCPLPVGDTAAYTPDAFLMPYTQFTGHGVIDVDGCKYLSNGLWCVRDGGVAGE